MTQFADVTTADFRVIDHGSVVSFEPLNLDAQIFVDNELYIEPWQYLGDTAFGLDHRPALQLRDILIEAGFSLQ